MKDILLKTNERKKEILLSAGAHNVYGSSSGEKDISGFNDTQHATALAQHLPAQINPEDKEMAQTIQQLQRHISNVSPTDIGS